jgi:hypothetical protein
MSFDIDQLRQKMFVFQPRPQILLFALSLVMACVDGFHWSHPLRPMLYWIRNSRMSKSSHQFQSTFVKSEEKSHRHVRKSFLTCTADSNGWMFPSAKDYHSEDKSLIEIPVLAVPFGDVLVTGDEKELALSRPMDILLAQQAQTNGTDIAHVVGSASGAGAAANHQGFLAGAIATRLRIIAVSGSVTAGDVSCTVRAVGRVRLDSLRRARPFRIALASPLRDRPPAAGAPDAALAEAARLYAECRRVHAALVEMEVAARLARLSRPDPTLLVPLEQHVELARAAADLPGRRREPASAAGRAGSCRRQSIGSCSTFD